MRTAAIFLTLFFLLFSLGCSCPYIASTATHNQDAGKNQDGTEVTGEANQSDAKQKACDQCDPTANEGGLIAPGGVVGR